MKSALILIAVAAMTVSGMSVSKNNAVSKFMAFKAKYGKAYASVEEERRRFKIFVENLGRAQALQATNPHATFGVNEYSDMSAAEFKSRHNGDKVYAKLASMHKADPSAVTPKMMAQAAGSKIDWRPKGAVTYVKNQGQCGSCWSFSTTGSIEGQNFLAGNPLVAVSEQEFVSCDTIDSGCNGGLMDNAFTWLLQAHNGTVVTEASYPYVSGDGNVPVCNMAGTVPGATITGYQDITKTEDAMAAFVLTGGPLSIAVDATSWQTYSGGILTDCISNQIDHGVLIVGYDDTNNPPYWIIKNSWGKSWGEAGYIRVGKGSNQCLITSYPTTSKVAKSGPTPPPAPPAPPGPAGSSFTQFTCYDARCSNCTSVSLPTGKCITGKSGSYMAQCATDALIVSAYVTRNCADSKPIVTANPLDQCLIHFHPKHTDVFIQTTCKVQPPATTTTTAAPAPPSPPSPPTPSGTFTQMQCTDTACSQGCQNATFNQGQCLQLNGGGSATVTCTSTVLNLVEYPLSSTCSGMSIPSTMPVDQCLQMQGGGSLENFCSSSSSASAVATKGSKLRKL